MFLLHGFKSVDIWFFVICGIIILILIVIYFLIPVFKRKQFAEARKNLQRREILFRNNQKEDLAEEIVVDDAAEPQAVDATNEALEAEVEKEDEVVMAAAEEVDNDATKTPTTEDEVKKEEAEINPSVLEPLEEKVEVFDFNSSLDTLTEEKEKDEKAPTEE